MLVLSRKVGQQVKIGDSIIVTITRIGGQAVRIGVEAPRDMAIVRSEIDSNQDVSKKQEK